MQSQGLELAFVNARAKAETLATLSKKSLGEVVCVSDNTIWQGGGVVGEMVGGLDPSVETGTQELTFSTYVVFELN